MKDKKSIESRRKLLKQIAAGSGAIVAGKSLPESWSRPVVDSVLLPAHALTSGQSGQIYSGYNLEAVVADNKYNQDDSMFAGLLNTVISPANAQGSIFLSGCAMVTGENVEFWMEILAFIVPFYVTGSMPLNGTGQATGVIPCEGAPPPATEPATVIDHSDAYIDIDIGIVGIDDVKIIPRFPAAQYCVEPLGIAQICPPP